MKTNTTLAAAALSGVLMLGACAGPAGQSSTSDVYGQSMAFNAGQQIAYGPANERLRRFSDDFRANAQDTVNFAFNRANLDSSARRALDGQVAWLKANEAVRMSVVGHTDLVGSERYNDRLGLRRARAVVNYLVRRGIPRNRLQAVESRGESEPIVATEARERRNRRTQTIVDGFGRYYVGTGLDGVYAERIYNNYQAGAFAVTEANSSDTSN